MIASAVAAGYKKGDFEHIYVMLESGEIGWGLTIYGALVAAVVGYFSLAVLLKALKGRWFWLFGPYCLAAGLLTLILV